MHARNNRGWRLARVRAAVKTIRACHVAIQAAVSDILTMRDRASMDAQVEKLDARIVDLNAKILRTDKVSEAGKMADKIARMKAKLRELNAQMPAEFRLEDIL